MRMMRKKYIFFKYYIKSKLHEKNASPDRIRRYLKNKNVVANGKVQTAEEINNCIKDMILSGNPFLAGRTTSFFTSDISKHNILNRRTLNHNVGNIRPYFGYLLCNSCKSKISFRYR